MSDEKTPTNDDRPEITPEEITPEEITPEEISPEASTETESIPPPPPPPPYEAPPQYQAPAVRLARREENKVIAGVCSGLAAYTGTDPVLWRIGAVIFGLLSFGIAIPAYIIGWLVMPVARPDEPVAPPRDLGEMNPGRWIAIAVIGIGAVILFRDIFHVRGGIIFGILLVGVGIAFWGRDFSSGPPRRPTPPAPPVPPAPPSGPLSAHSTWESGSAPTTPMPTTPIPPVPPPPFGRGAPTSPVPPSPRPPRDRTRRESSILGRLVIGAAALAVATGLIIENIWFDIPAKIYLAVLLGIVGLGLLIGAWLGRARWLIFLGAGLAFCLMSVSFVPLEGGGRMGEVSWNPVSLRQINNEEPYRHTAGEAVLDLSDVDFDRARSIDVRIGFGQLLVIVPREADVEVDARVQGGEMTIFGDKDAGWSVRKFVESEGTRGEGPIRLELRMSFGEMNVRRAGSSDDANTFNFGDNDNRFDFDFNTPRVRNR